MKTGKRVISSIVVIFLIFSLSLSAFAQDAPISPSTSADYVQGGERLRPDYPQVPVYICSMLSAKAYNVDGTAYMALGDVCGMYGMDALSVVTDEGFTVTGTEIDAVGEKDAFYFRVNGRYVYIPEGYISCGDDVYLSLDTLCHVFRISGKFENNRVDISTAQGRIITGGESYYKTHMAADEYYWMPRIIFAEAKEQPLAGLIGVGNVVYNRVADENFPDDIFKVLYDDKYAVQFPPAAAGSIHGRPDEISKVAAYLCFEGYNTVEDSLYFVNPENNGNYWFRTNRQYVTAIGNHEFYR